MAKPVDEAHYLQQSHNLQRVIRSQCHVRRWLAQRAAKRLAKQRAKRHNLMLELLVSLQCVKAVEKCDYDAMLRFSLIYEFLVLVEICSIEFVFKLSLLCLFI